MPRRKSNPWAEAKPPGTQPPATAPRSYMAEALAEYGKVPGGQVRDGGAILAAIILAQALDRASSRLIDAAAVSNYKRE